MSECKHYWDSICVNPAYSCLLCDIEELEGRITTLRIEYEALRLDRDQVDADRDRLQAKLDAVELENKVLRNEESYEEWLTYVRSKTQEQKDE